MASTHNVAVLVGSLRKESWNRKLANALPGLAPDTLTLALVEIGQLPLYNQDADAKPPAEWAASPASASGGGCGPFRDAGI